MSDDTKTTPDVYRCIAAVAGDLAKIGIAKASKNAQQGYAFRGIDAVYNTLAPLLAQHGLVILPRILTRTQTERATRGGGALFSVVVEAEFDFVAVSDGSVHTIRTCGEAMDSADKATNKAMSAAYKYAAFMSFCVPTEGDDDADLTTHDVAAAVPPGFVEWWTLAVNVAETRGIKELAALWGDSDSTSSDIKRYVAEAKADEWAALKRTAQAVQP